MSEDKGAGISPEFYATLELGLDTWHGIAYDAVRRMIEKYCPDTKRALDYGCGAGRSTRFLKQIGFDDVIGVDINEEMLEKAYMREMPGTSYHIIKSGVVPCEDGAFDLVFSGLVLLEISRKEEIRKVLAEFRRVVAPQGTIMIMTCTKEGSVTGADSFEPLLTEEQKDHLKDGDPVPTLIKETGQIFNDYFWSEEFLRVEIEKVGLRIVEVNLPSRDNDTPRYAIYVSKKMK